MKKASLLSFALLLGFCSLAQSTEFTWMSGLPYPNYAADLERTDDGRWVLAYSRFDGFGGFLVIDTLHQISQQSAPTNEESYYSQFDLIKKPQGDGWYAWGAQSECDVIYAALLEFDEDLNYISAQPTGDFWPLTNTPLQILDNGDLVFTEYDALTRTDPSLNEQWSVPYPNPVGPALATANGRLYLNTADGIVQIDPADGTVLASFPQFSFNILLSNDEGLTLGVNGSKVYLLDEDFQQLGSTDFGFEIMDIDFDSSHVAALGTTVPNDFVVKTTDLNFDGAQQFAFPANLFPQRVRLNEQEVFVSGKETYPSDEQASFIKSYSLGGTTIAHGRDAGINAVQQGSLNLTYMEYGDLLQFHNFRVSVHNYGNTVLDSVWVRARLPWINTGFCGEYQLVSQQFKDLQLMPGASTILTLADFEAFLQSPTENLELRFMTYLPDNYLDDDHANDMTTSTVFVGVDNAHKPDLKAYFLPNPFSETCRLDFSDPLWSKAQLRLVNPLGQTLLEDQLALGATSKQLDVASLPNGLYFLHLEVSGFKYVWSLAKQ